MNKNYTPYIINASANLLGICFVIITGLKLSGVALYTLADEVAMFASIGYMSSLILSYLSIRTKKDTTRYERIADIIFILATFSLLFSVFAFASDLI